MEEWMIGWMEEYAKGMPSAEEWKNNQCLERYHLPGLLGSG